MPTNASQMFHPLDKSQKAEFYRAHDVLMARMNAFRSMQDGPNPITEHEFRLLQEKRPERWAGFSYISPTGGENYR